MMRAPVLYQMLRAFALSSVPAVVGTLQASSNETDWAQVEIAASELIINDRPGRSRKSKRNSQTVASGKRAAIKAKNCKNHRRHA